MHQTTTITPRFNDDLLAAYADRFFGYGNLKAKFWFIGLEEGGGEFTGIDSKLRTWDKRGCKPIDDLRDFHLEAGISEWFKPNPKFQNLWGAAIKILTSIEGNKFNLSQIKKYQAEQFCSANGNECLLELLPLPNKGKNHWEYHKWSGLKFCVNRNEYERHFLESRINSISRYITEHMPSSVVFFGISDQYRSAWKQIANVNFREKRVAGLRYYMAYKPNQIYVIARHPSSRIPDAYLAEIGNHIGQFITR